MQEDQDRRRQLAEQWVDAQRALSPLATLRVHSQQGECAVIISRSTFGESCAEIAFTALHCNRSGPLSERIAPLALRSISSLIDTRLLFAS